MTSIVRSLRHWGTTRPANSTKVTAGSLRRPHVSAAAISPEAPHQHHEIPDGRGHWSCDCGATSYENGQDMPWR